MSAPAPLVVAIPAKDEAELLPLCLDALARQTGVAFDDFVVVVGCNNCSDGTPELARSLAARLPFELVVEECVLPPPIAHAGGARRHAMDAALARVREDGILATTDADCVADRDWLSTLADAFAKGADAVAGRVDTDWEQLCKFPADVLEIGAVEWEYQLLCAELEAYLDPEPTNPWPRHNQTCGANTAIRAPWYRRIGGLPVIRTGEDAALFEAVFRRDGVIRNAMGPHVTASARLTGRAQGGMADALTSRHGDAYLCDDLLEPAGDLARRARWRHAARAAFAKDDLKGWATRVGLPALAIERAGRENYFGQAWRQIEANTPSLVKRRLSAATIRDELRHVQALVRDLTELNQENAA